jgi:hypothetical protein
LGLFGATTSQLRQDETMNNTKWTIYNNTLPWSELSDKQKGKMLLANHSGIEIKGVGILSLQKPVKFNVDTFIYFAKKPERTMAELFALDIMSSSGFLTTHDINDLIAKGWVKK